MKGWKIGGIVSFSLVTLVYGIILYEFSSKGAASSVIEILKSYPIILLIFVPIGIVIGLIISVLKSLGSPKRGKKGQIWVSTVIYIALGIVIITIILAAGMPLLSRMKDRNTFIESKTLMHALSEAIDTVVSEGPGSRRVLDPVIIKGGKLIFDEEKNQVRWEMKTETLLMESCEDNDKDNECDNTDAIMREGSLKQYLIETFVVGEYMANIAIDYGSNIDIDLSGSDIKGPLTGSYLIAISNDVSGTAGTTVGIYIS